MARIAAASHASPLNIVSQAEIKRTASRILAPLGESEVLAIFDHAQVRQRQFVMPLDWYLRPASAAERNRIYLEQGLPLALDAARRCLDSADCRPTQVDHIVFISSTGHATPTLDTFLINQLGLRPGTSRVPIWGTACAGGAAGLSRAFEHCTAFPDHRVLVVALECCSLAHAARDFSKKNLVAMSLFGDGAGAVLVEGSALPGGGPEILASHSYLFPDSYRVLGLDFLDDGMHLVLAPELPLIMRQELSPLITEFLDRNGLRPSQLDSYITHPGGARVLEAYREALGLRGTELSLSESVLEDHGNVSSVTVLIVLERWLALRAAGSACHSSGSRIFSDRSRDHSSDPRPPVGGYGLLSAFGPGLSAELLLLRG